MKQHAVEIADDTDGYCLTCVCGEWYCGSSWEEAGKKMDKHIESAYQEAQL